MRSTRNWLVVKMMGKSSYLKEQGLSLGMCDAIASLWHEGMSDEELCSLYFKGIDFCISHDWPDKEYIKTHFSEELRHSHGVYIDESIPASGLPKVDKFMLLGHCRGTLSFGGFDVVCIYVRHDSEINVVAKDLSSVRVFVYDYAKVHVSCDSANRVYVYSYDDSFVTQEGRVTVRARGYHDEL